MSLKMSALALTAFISLTACAGISGDEARKNRAYNDCYTKAEEAKAACIRTQTALYEAEDRKWAESLKTKEEAAERRQSELEAYGVPREDAQQSVEAPLKLPD